MIKLQHDHIERNANIGQGLDGDQQVRNGGNTFDSADENQAEHGSNRQTGISGGKTEGIINASVSPHGIAPR